MNKVILMGRLTADPEIRFSQGKNGEQLCIARFTLAIDRRGKDAGADFINIVSFGKQAEFAEKYLKKATKIAVSGRIQTGSYTNKEGRKVNTFEVIVEEQEFAESKGSVAESKDTEPPAAPDDFIHIPEGAIDSLPFK